MEKTFLEILDKIRKVSLEILDKIRKVKIPTERQYVVGFAVMVALLALVHFLTQEKAPEQEAQVDLAYLTIDKPHRIWSVSNFKNAFPDGQDVQILAAERWGVRPVQNRDNAEKRKKELVYIGASPYYYVDNLRSSIPYLVPRAAVLLQDIGQAFYDSLYVKGVPLNQLIVTSVMRSMDDVAKLQRHNQNATERSCHLYGTTFDICYNRYHPVVKPVRDDTLKWVLSEVLRDMRQQERCYVKYEVKQGCFHITVR